MKILVHYVDFHPDNHQGGSGKSFEFSKTFEVEQDCRADQIIRVVGEKLIAHVRKQRPYNDIGEDGLAIQKLEILL